LNPSEEESKSLLKLMLFLERAVLFFNREVSALNPTALLRAFEAKHAEAVVALQAILANEWKVVKSKLGVVAPEALPSPRVSELPEANAR
jgi:hypothetical protein